MSNVYDYDSCCLLCLEVIVTGWLSLLASILLILSDCKRPTNLCRVRLATLHQMTSVTNSALVRLSEL